MNMARKTATFDSDRARALGPKPAAKIAVLPGQRTLLAALTVGLFVLLAALAGLVLLASGSRSGILGSNGTPDETPGSAAGGGLSAAEIPKVEPVRYLDVDRENAREINARVPFSTDPVPAASPLLLQIPAVDRARATDCLAAAAWYEAGDDIVGQQAVTQVVLNRMRHPAFPKSVCEVVFQGSERATGCQFSFTCDGSMTRRRPAPTAWSRARGTAYAALNGLVFPAVGWATHYHTDWVVPYWSAKVDKIAAVDTHLFFRWVGRAGRPPAFTGRHRGTESVIAKMAGLSPAHVAGATLSEADGQAGETELAAAPEPTLPQPGAPAIPAGLLRGNLLLDRDPAANAFLVQIVDQPFAGTLALMALDLCNLQPGKPCQIFATTAAAGSLNATGRPATGLEIEFQYMRDNLRNRESAQWNCARWERPSPTQCLPGSAPGAG